MALIPWQVSHLDIISKGTSFSRNADIVALTGDIGGRPSGLIQSEITDLSVVMTSIGSIVNVVLGEITGIITSKHARKIVDACAKLATSKEF